MLEWPFDLVAVFDSSAMRRKYEEACKVAL